MMDPLKSIFIDNAVDKVYMVLRGAGLARARLELRGYDAVAVAVIFDYAEPFRVFRQVVRGVDILARAEQEREQKFGLFKP